MGVYWNNKRKKYYVGYRGLDRKWHREAVGANFKLAQDVLAKRKAEVAEGRFFPERATRAVSFAEAADKFYELHLQHTKSKSWRPMLERAKERFGVMKLVQIRPDDIQRYINEIATRASNATANRHRTLISSVFNKAKSWRDFYGENPCSAVKKRKEPPHRLRFLTPPEIEKLLAVMHPRLRPLFLAAVLTGMRRGELLGLDWKNVDLRTGVIYLLETKSGRPREIPILPQLREVLEGLGPRAEGKVFNMPYITLRRHFEKAKQTADITDFRWHDARHSMASNFIMATGDLPSLQRILGHSTPAMTLRYAHLSRSHLTAAMARFGAAMPILKAEEASEGSGGGPGSRAQGKAVLTATCPSRVTENMAQGLEAPVGAV